MITIGDFTGIISYLGDFSSFNTFGGNDVVIYNFFATAVPEPSTYALLGLTGFFSLQWDLRRKPADVKNTDEKTEDEMTEAESNM